MSRRGGMAPQMDEEQFVMQSMLVKLTMSINKQCFQECVSSFKEEKLTSGEASCIQQCAKRHSGAFTAMNDIGEQLAQRGGGLF